MSALPRGAAAHRGDYPGPLYVVGSDSAVGLDFFIVLVDGFVYWCVFHGLHSAPTCIAGGLRSERILFL